MNDDRNGARSLECRTGRAPADFDELQRLRAAAWHQHGAISLDPNTILDPWVKQTLLNEAARQYGERNMSPAAGSGSPMREGNQGDANGLKRTNHEPVARKSENGGMR